MVCVGCTVDLHGMCWLHGSVESRSLEDRAGHVPYTCAAVIGYRADANGAALESSTIIIIIIIIIKNPESSIINKMWPKRLYYIIWIRDVFWLGALGPSHRRTCFGWSRWDPAPKGAGILYAQDKVLSRTSIRSGWNRDPWFMTGHVSRA